MQNREIIIKTAEFARQKLSGESTGHDWWHTYRVWQLSKRIAEKEGGVNLIIVELAALLHDIADWKFSGGDDSAGPKIAREWLEKQQVKSELVSHICEIIKNISFKGVGVISKPAIKEGMIVQDADRLDAIGAIGLARAFAYGGYKHREIYNPEVKPIKHQTFEQYKNSPGTTINHFYEKLLLLKDLMNTETAKKMAEERHQFMEEYLKQFFKEWEVE